MKNIHKNIFITLLILSIPNFTLAASNLAGFDFREVVNEIVSIRYILLPVLNGCAFVFFFWGLSKFILNTDKPEEIKNGKNYMMWGILVLFILISFQSIIWFISNELQIGGNPSIPSVYLPTGSGANVSTSCVVQLPDGTFVSCD